MSQKLDSKVAVIGIDIGKNSFHIVGQDRHGALVLRQKWSRGQVEARLANVRRCSEPTSTLTLACQGMDSFELAWGRKLMAIATAK